LSETTHALSTAEYQEICHFIDSEADLLDRAQFEEWLGLFTEDGVYWVPADHDQADHLSHVSLFYDDYGTLKTRVARLLHPGLHCQSPPSRTVRVVGRPLISADQLGAVARCKFVMVEDRVGAEKRLFAGTYEYTLRREGDRLKMARKKVVLTDCDQSFPALTIPF
jgi:benzoate/toluate 1,2-dioxygenase beta subunit